MKLGVVLCETCGFVAWFTDTERASSGLGHFVVEYCVVRPVLGSLTRNDTATESPERRVTLGARTTPPGAGPGGGGDGCRTANGGEPLVRLIHGTESPPGPFALARHT